MSEVTLIILTYLFAKLALDAMQIHTTKTAKVDTKSAILLGIDEQQESKSRSYNISKLRISMLRNIIYMSWVYFLLIGGGVYQINAIINIYFVNDYLINLLTVLTVLVVIVISMLPLSYYSTFVIETKYEFNTSTKLLFLKDQLISIVMSLVLVAFISSVFFYIIDFKDMWWFLMALTIFSITIISIFIYPTYISPLFNKFQNLDDEEIKNEIDDLSKRTNFSIDNLFVMNQSKRSKHPNAYFTGFSKNRRIVFYDTLLELLNPKEIKAVLAHEIGHYKHKHISKSLLLSTIIIFLGLFVLSNLINSSAYLELLNLPFNEASQLIALIFTYQVVSFFIDPFFSVLSRKNEYEADSFASKQVDKSLLISSLTKLYKSNLTFLIPNKLYAMVYYSHPTVLERINNLNIKND
ncbi:MAG: M48 family metallopeptidase [Gammaproteobacteria bacterium]